ncbi:MAG: hypothetical protein FGM41_11810, partial [Bacteroidetes bacterium]|nr:hypothetical protein [Bacteroidota bacterium]
MKQETNKETQARRDFLKNIGKFGLGLSVIPGISQEAFAKESNTLIQANLNKTIRIAGLVVEANHRVSKNGRNFGILGIEDFTGKTEQALFG